jgi:hypothetical protein
LLWEVATRAVAIGWTGEKADEVAMVEKRIISSGAVMLFCSSGRLDRLIFNIL